MRCSNCNSKIPEDEKGKFCPYCGAETVPDKDRIPTWENPTWDDWYDYKPKPRTSDTLEKGFKILSDNIGSILIYWLIPIILIISLSILQQYFLMDIVTAMEETTDPSVVFDYLFDLLVLMVPMSLIISILQVTFIGGVVGMAKEAYETGKTSYMTGFQVLKKHPMGIIGVSIIITIGVNVGVLLCLIPGFLLCYWWLFAIPVIVIEGKNIFGALSSSKDFAKDNETIKFTIVLVVVVILISMVGGILYTVISFLIDLELFSLTYIILSPIITGIFSIIALSFLGICITVHYLNGRSRKYDRRGQERNVPPPPPPDMTEH